MTTGTKERWHVGKEIPLAVVTTMICQFAAIVWFASSIDSRIDINVASIGRNSAALINADIEINKLSDAIAAQNVLNGRLDVTLHNINRTLEGVNRQMEASGR